jgi:hypothetical protein
MCAAEQAPANDSGTHFSGDNMPHPTDQRADARPDQQAGSVVVQKQSVQAIRAELALRTSGVIDSVSCLQKAQQITQESLQLEVCV